MNLTRRSFIRATTGLLASAALLPKAVQAAGKAQIKIGACVVGLDAAKQAGLEGVQVRAGNAADELEIFKAATRAQYKAQMQSAGLPICSLMMGLLNEFPLATDPRGPAWLAQCIDAAKDLGVANVLVAFFGKGDLQSGKRIKEPEFTSVVQRLKAAAPRAKDAGVTLAVENMLSAEQNLRLLDEINHDAVSLYYDVFNTGKTQKYDSPAEIRLLKGRISQIHYKNGPQYLDEDKPHFEAVTAALKDIGYSGWIVLETSSPSKNGVADAKRNGDFVRALFA
jgi:sugar phosphate isomerase/epimerase